MNTTNQPSICPDCGEVDYPTFDEFAGTLVDTFNNLDQLLEFFSARDEGYEPIQDQFADAMQSWADYYTTNTLPFLELPDEE